MADVFISYSRKEFAFARILHQTLIENDLDIWIDWEDIPPCADWLGEVYKAIEQADSFIVSSSTSSVTSATFSSYESRSDSQYDERKSQTYRR